MSHVLLLVDDEKSYLNAWVQILQREDYVVLTAGNGSDALDVLAQNRVDLALVDYILPDMNGFELMKVMKTRYPETIRIMLTGKPDLDLMTMVGKDKDILQGYITKPFGAEALKDKLTMYLSRPRIAKASERPEPQKAEKKIDSEEKK